MTTMSSQDTVTEGERKKANVARDENAEEREPGFKDGEKVKMKVTEPVVKGGTRTFFKTFTVAASQCPVSSWKYQLYYDGVLHAQGAWFPEDDLRAA